MRRRGAAHNVHQQVPPMETPMGDTTGDPWCWEGKPPGTMESRPSACTVPEAHRGEESAWRA